ncbi:hypothetical protein B0T16DRAFT_397626 [Cercophora newfieldiana]|uniref:Ankyrin repeat protein n=1 Tax=Cercophora newfieldiana TaxID=92897 RepID=A0AA39YND3_9PEZI|nr:hypothetical protein B0T16DRAFT_397626 [Cercophora newfieldiana]
MGSKPPKLPVPIADLVKHVTKQPQTPLAELMEPYRQYEAHLRQAFAQEPESDLLKDPFVNVVPLFTEDTPNIKVRARNLAAESSEEKGKYIMPLPKDIRRPDGSPAVVSTHKEFQRNFSVFSESSLAELDWTNVVAAGSSVVNCLLPVPEQYNGTKRMLREFYHEKFSPASDVDLFLYGLSDEEAVQKIKDIEASVRDVLLTETTTIRTKHAITICSQYPTRHIQIVLRVYKSVSEILTGFDIDCSGAAYDGKQVYCTPRALQSYMTQINHIDLTRRSPSYENRLSKYSHRGFEVYWPELDRTRVDPTIFERSFQRTLGLARLLVLERLPTASSRDSYLDKRREERGRPRIDRYSKFARTLAGNIKEEHEDEIADWLNEEDVSNYHTFMIPYGQRFTAKKIEKLCYTRDLLLNAEWNLPEDREVYLHRHPAFFGRVEDVVNDCCGYCPVPKTDEEKEIAEQEAKNYVSGKISFMKDDPGRQEIGSFNPLTDDDWTEMAYVGNTSRLCSAIVDGDLEHVEDWLAQEGANPDTRDFTGRNPLHLAVMSSTPEIVRRLVDAGARLVARVADGRTALHLAAARGNVEIIKILMDNSVANEAEFEAKNDQRRKAKKAAESTGEDSDAEMVDVDSDAEMSDAESAGKARSTVTMASIATGSFVEVKRKSDEESKDEQALDAEEEPDFFDVNVVAWDTPCSAVHLAIIEGHEDVVKTLCQDYGADILLPVKFFNSQKEPSGSLLTLALALALPVEKAVSMAKTLLSLGTTSAQADLNGTTAFQQYVESNAESLVRTLLEMDNTGSKSSINHVLPSEYGAARTPLQAAVRRGNLNLVVQLLEEGAATQVDFESWLKSVRQSTWSNRLSSFEENQKRFNASTEQPLIVALRSSKLESALLLLEKGADPNVITSASHAYMQSSWRRDGGESALDLVTALLKTLRAYKGEKVATVVRPIQPDNIDTYLDEFKEGSYQRWIVSNDIDKEQKVHRQRLKQYEKDLANSGTVVKGAEEKMSAIKDAIATLEKIEGVMRAKGAKTFGQLFPDYRDILGRATSPSVYPSWHDAKKVDPYKYVFSFRSVNDVTAARHVAYLKLFEAAWSGDLETIKKLTLTSWDEDKVEAPLKIAVTDNSSNSPFSLAFFRGHHAVAKAILDISQAQYSPEEKPKKRFRAQEDDDEYSDAESDDPQPQIYSQTVGGDFTIENVGQVSMKVNSRTKPLNFLGWSCRAFAKDGTPGLTGSPFTHVIRENDLRGLKTLLDWAEHFGAQKLDPEGETFSFFSFPDGEFNLAVKLGRTEILSEVIKRTGAGLPLELLVKDSGVELKEKPQYYQGLTVYGKKRNDWATAGRESGRRDSGSKTSPLLLAALAGCFESTIWFLSDVPLHHYLDFAKSKAARSDVRLKHLASSPGGIEGAVTKWLDDQSELVIHAAILAPPRNAATDLVSYLVKTRPALIEVKSVQQMTPLQTTCFIGRLDMVEILVKAGANQSTKESGWKNLLHSALHFTPTARQLRGLLELLDRDLVVRMLRERSSLDSLGRTPLHLWIGDVVGKTRYKDTDEILDVLRLLLELSSETATRALQMLDAAGDTPLHTLVFKNTEDALAMARVIIELDPTLLFRENAVGRTPIEVAREMFINSRVQASKEPYWTDNAVMNWPGVNPSTFLKKSDEDASQPREHEDSSNVANMWHLCEEALAKFPTQPKRRLVSLYEANDVAKRLGEQHMRARYQFQVRATSDSDDEEKASEAAGCEEVPRKRKRKGDDIVSQTIGRGVLHAWKKKVNDS